MIDTAPANVVGFDCEHATDEPMASQAVHDLCQAYPGHDWFVVVKGGVMHVKSMTISDKWGMCHRAISVSPPAGQQVQQRRLQGPLAPVPPEDQERGPQERGGCGCGLLRERRCGQHRAGERRRPGATGLGRADERAGQLPADQDDPVVHDADWALQEAQVIGIVASYQYWKYKEKKTYEPLVDDAGQPMFEARAIPSWEGEPKVVEDKPCIDLMPIENIRFDPGATGPTWWGPARTSSAWCRCTSMTCASR
jgi:hypothetical protein